MMPPGHAVGDRLEVRQVGHRLTPRAKEIAPTARVSYAGNVSKGSRIALGLLAVGGFIVLVWSGAVAMSTRGCLDACVVMAPLRNMILIGGTVLVVSVTALIVSARRRSHREDLEAKTGAR